MASEFESIEKDPYWCGHPSIEILEGSIYYYAYEASVKVLQRLTLTPRSASDHPNSRSDPEDAKRAWGEPDEQPTSVQQHHHLRPRLWSDSLPHGGASPALYSNPLWPLYVAQARPPLAGESQDNPLAQDVASDYTTSNKIVLLVRNIPPHVSPAELTSFILQQCQNKLSQYSQGPLSTATGLDSHAPQPLYPCSLKEILQRPHFLELIKVLHGPTTAEYSCLLFCSSPLAALCLLLWIHKKPYNSLESAKCFLYLIKGVSVNQTNSTTTNNTTDESVTPSDSLSTHSIAPTSHHLSTGGRIAIESDLAGCSSPHSRHFSSRLSLPPSAVVAPPLDTTKPPSATNGEPCSSARVKHTQRVHDKKEGQKQMSRDVSCSFLTSTRAELGRRLTGSSSATGSPLRHQHVASGLQTLPCSETASSITLPESQSIEENCCSCTFGMQLHYKTKSEQESIPPVDPSSSQTDAPLRLSEPENFRPFIPVLCTCACHSRFSVHDCCSSRSLPEDVLFSTVNRKLSEVAGLEYRDLLESEVQHLPQTLDNPGVALYSPHQRGSSKLPKCIEPSCLFSLTRERLPPRFCTPKSERNRRKSSSQNFTAVKDMELAPFSIDLRCKAGRRYFPHHSNASPRCSLQSPFVLIGRLDWPAFCGVCLEQLPSCLPTTKNSYFSEQKSSNIGSLKSYQHTFSNNGVDPNIVTRTSSSDAYALLLSENDVAIHILCGHMFHAACLGRWYDATCPYCRFQQYPSRSSSCDICGTQDHVTMCLICGFLGCNKLPETATRNSSPYGVRGVHGKDTSCEKDSDYHEDGSFPPRLRCHAALLASTPSHATQHYTDTQHIYALEVQSQRVWDFSRQGYVYRMLQSCVDGKMVELIQGVGESQTCPGSPRRLSCTEENAPSTLWGGPEKCKTLPPGDARLLSQKYSRDSLTASSIDVKEYATSTCRLDEEPIFVSKIVCEYDSLLQSQLDKLRQYYERCYTEMRKTLFDVLKDAESQNRTARDMLNTLKLRVAELENKIDKELSKYEELQRHCNEAKRHSVTLEEVHRRLTARVTDQADAIETLSISFDKRRAEKLNRIAELESELADLTFHIRTQVELVDTGQIQPTSFVVGTRSVHRRGGRRRLRGRPNR